MQCKDCFNSLQTRKRITRSVTLQKQRVWCSMFQFPSNGKAYPKNCRDQQTRSDGTCFNSLQTGKPIQRKTCARIGRFGRSRSFNSLQTGKPIQRKTVPMVHKSTTKSFNSLQTGKPIQSSKTNAMRKVLENYRFNSLQTGKPIQR